MYVCVCVCVYVCMYVCMYVCVCVCVCVCMYIYIYIYIYIYMCVCVLELTDLSNLDNARFPGIHQLVVLDNALAALGSNRTHKLIDTDLNETHGN